MSTDYTLQFNYHEEIFSDRETAIKYISKYFTPDALIGQPYVCFYGDEEEPSVILAIGAGDRTAALIDVDELDERLSELEGSNSSETESASNALTLIEGIIDATGITYDTNKITGQITYDPDSKDELLADTTSLAEAISVLSQYIQKNVESNTFSIDGSDGVTIVSSTDDSGETVYTASVNISEHGNSDSNTFNDNIIGLKSDGLYASVDMSYDEDSNVITFVKSGVVDGEVVDDAQVTTIDLGAHTEYSSDNSDNTVSVEIDNDTHVVSANVKLSSEEYNLLSVKDGGYLYASGKSNAIKFKDTTVYTALNEALSDISSLEETVSDIQSGIEEAKTFEGIEGDTTDTLEIAPERESTGVYKITGDVRLGSNNSIITANGGLEVNMTFKSDLENNQLVITLGDTEYKLDYPSVDVISSAYYDSDSKEFVFAFNNGSTVRVSASQLAVAYVFSNSTSSPIHFDTEISGTTTTVSAELLLASSDNMLSIDSNGCLVAPLSVVTNAVSEETTRATEVEEALQASIEEEIERAKSAEESNSSSVVTLTSTVEVLETRITNNEEAIDTINADENTVNSIRYIVNHAIEDEEKARENADTTLQSSIDSFSDTISTLKESVSGYASQDALDSEVSRATEVEEGLSDELSKKIESVTITKSEGSDLIYNLNVDGTMTEIVLPSAGDGLKESDNEYSVLIDTNSESYLTVSESGLSLNGIDDAISAKADSSDVETIKEEIEDEISRATLAENEINDTLSLLSSDVETLNGKIDNKIETVTLESVDGNSLIYQLNVDGVTVSTLNIPESQLLQGVTYDSDTKTLEFVFDVDGESKTIEIDIADLVDTYYAGNGLTESENTFSVLIDPDSETYLKVSENGLILSGINDELDKKIETVTLKKDDGDDLTYHLYVDDDVTEINIPSAGDGLKESDNEYSVFVNTAEKYLVVDESGLRTTGIDEIADNVTGLSSAVSAIEEDIETVNNTMISLETRIESVESDVDEVKADISSLSDKVDDLSGNVSDIDDLSDDISDIEDDIDKINEKIDELTEAMDNMIDFGTY